MDQAQALAGWIIGINKAVEKSGMINTSAALLGGIAVAASTIRS